MKATEFALFVSMVGVVVLRRNVSKRIYNNFLMLHVAIRVLSSEEFCYTRNEYARKLLIEFVRDCEEIYGPEFISSNVHSLIHLSSDVVRFGPLHNFSAFPFENYLQSLKKMLRKSEKPLQQVVKRLIEIDNVRFSSKAAKIPELVFRREHNDGPLFPGYSGKQYKNVTFKKNFLSSCSPDSCVYLKDFSIVKIENILEIDQQAFIVGRKFVNKQDLYTYPLKSSHLHIFLVNGLSRLNIWPLELFLYKANLLPISRSVDKFASFPLIMQSSY